MINSGSAANATALPLMLVALRVLIKEHTRMHFFLIMIPHATHGAAPQAIIGSKKRSI